MSLVFDDFAPKDYAFFRMVSSALQTIGSLFVIPVLCGKFQESIL
jgi:hypothetical protein